MEGSWNNNRAHYRCQVKPADIALAAAGHPASIYVREDKIVDRIDDWLQGLFSPQTRERTIDTLYRAGEDPAATARDVARLLARGDGAQGLRRDPGVGRHCGSH